MATGEGTNFVAFGDSYAHGAAEDLLLLRAILSEARQVVSLWGGRMYFVYLPTWERYRISALASQNRDAILSIVNQLRIPIIDLHHTFASHPDPLSLFPSRRYAHYNVAGHQLVGSEIVTRLAMDGGSIASTDASQTFASRSGLAHRDRMQGWDSFRQTR